MKKILTIVGARPQFVKAAVVSRVLRAHERLTEILVHTGQHYDQNMSDIFFKEMDIPRPDHHLGVHGLGHGAMTGQMLEKIETVLISEKPDGVMVYGDTNSTLAGALAARKLHIPVAHVEAGLRSFNMRMPEEVNRIVTDRISDILFYPTETARNNLMREGFSNFSCRLIKSGDVMYDAALFYSDRAKAPMFDLPAEFLLATIHRAENTDDRERLTGIVKAINEIHRGLSVVLPIHPRTKKVLEDQHLELTCQCVDPVGYLEMVHLIKSSTLIMTDSGGLQKEAYFFKKPCLTLRDETEWTELVSAGANRLVGAEYAKILEGFIEMRGREISGNDALYGNGDAGQKIADELA